MSCTQFIKHLFVALFLAASISACSSPEDYFEIGVAHYQEGRYEEAALEFKNILEEDENNTKARYWLALTYEKRDNWDKAYQQYLKITQFDPKHIQATIKLADIYADYDMPEKLMESIELIQEIDPDNKAAKLLRAKSYLLNGDYKQARIQAQNLYESEKSKTPDTTLFLADLYTKQDELDKSIALLKQGVKDNPSDILLLLALAKTQVKSENHLDVPVLLDKIKRSPSRRTNSTIELALLYVNLDMLDEAEEVLRDGVSRFSDVSSKSALIEFLINLRSHALAYKEAQAFVAETPNAHELRYLLAQLHEMIDENDNAIKDYEYIISHAKQDEILLEAQLSLAQLLVEQNKIESAETILDEVLEEDPYNDQARVLRGELYLKEGLYPLALAQVRRVLKNDAVSFPALSLLARIHENRNNMPLAMSALRQAIASNPEEPSVRIKLANLMDIQGDTSNAIQVLEEALEETSGQPQVLKSLLDLQIKTQDWEGAISSVVNYKKARSQTAASYYLAGTLCQKMGDVEAARREFELALEQEPDASEPLTAIVHDFIAEDMGFLAIERVEEVINAFPDAFFAYQLLGEAEKSESSYDAAETAFRKAIESQPKWSAPYISLGDMFMEIGASGSAFTVYQQGMTQSTDRLAVQLRISSAHEKLGEFDRAIENYEKIIDKYPKAYTALNNLARLLITHKNDERSLNRALEVVQPLHESDVLEYKDTLGWVLYKNNKFNDAISVLTDLVEKAPQVAKYQYHLGMAFSKIGYKNLAKRHLTNAVNKSTEFNGYQEAKETLTSL